MSQEFNENDFKYINPCCEKFQLLKFLSKREVRNMEFYFDLKREKSPNVTSDYEKEGKISLAYEQMTEIPDEFIKCFANGTLILDLTENDFKDISFLSSFCNMHTLILDNNINLDVDTFPMLHNLRTLWLNGCAIVNVSKWAKTIRRCCPTIKYVSFLKNPGTINGLNGASDDDVSNYRKYILTILPRLEHLDDSHVTKDERCSTATFRRAFARGIFGYGSDFWFMSTYFIGPIFDNMPDCNN